MNISICLLVSLLIGCNETKKEDVVDPEPSDVQVPMETWYADGDNDGFGGEIMIEAVDAPDGFVGVSGDCNDADSNIHPEAEEVCDEVDNNCDDLVDEDAIDIGSWYLDVDGDGHGAGDVVISCTAPEWHVVFGDDCNDENADIHPSATEICDAIDNDCDGVADQDMDPDWPANPDLWTSISNPESILPYIQLYSIMESPVDGSIWALFEEYTDYDFIPGEYYYSLYELVEGEWVFSDIITIGTEGYIFSVHMDVSGRILIGGAEYGQGQSWLFREHGQGFFTEFSIDYEGAEERTVTLSSPFSTWQDDEVVLYFPGQTSIGNEDYLGLWKVDSTGIAQLYDTKIADREYSNHKLYSVALETLYFLFFIFT